MIMFETVLAAGPVTCKEVFGFVVPIPTLPDPVMTMAVPALVENCATFPVVVVLMTVRTFEDAVGTPLNVSVVAVTVAAFMVPV